MATVAHSGCLFEHVLELIDIVLGDDGHRNIDSLVDRPTLFDLVKRFDDLDIDWTILEKQLQTWSHLFRIGKRLRIDISFNYIETGDPVGVR